MIILNYKKDFKKVYMFCKIDFYFFLIDNLKYEFYCIIGIDFIQFMMIFKNEFNLLYFYKIEINF